MSYSNINFGELIQPTQVSGNNTGQVTFMPEFINTLNAYQSDGFDYLYDLEPQSQNLFWVGYFRQAKDGNGEVKPFYNAAYRIRKITIPMPTLDVENCDDLRAPLFKEAKYKQELEIDWFEDVYHSVRKYHLDWVARWYNRQFDVLRCGVNGKFRQCTVVAYHYINSDVNSIIEVPEIQPIMAFKIGGLVPKDIPDITFDHEKPNNEQMLTMKYQFSLLQWVYSD